MLCLETLNILILEKFNRNNSVITSKCVDHNLDHKKSENMVDYVDEGDV